MCSDLHPSSFAADSSRSRPRGLRGRSAERAERAGEAARPRGLSARRRSVSFTLGGVTEKKVASPTINSTSSLAGIGLNRVNDRRRRESFTYHTLRVMSVSLSKQFCSLRRPVLFASHCIMVCLSVGSSGASEELRSVCVAQRSSPERCSLR